MRDLEKLTGIDKGYLSKIETGELPNPTLSTVCRLALALEVDLSELLRGVRIPETSTT